jgi:hypothetical protein
VAAPPSRLELLELYRYALEEYRFTVRLNWDRTQYYLALNVGLLAAAVGLVKLGLPGPMQYLPALIFAGGVGACWVGMKAAIVGHNYYRQARDGKAAYEALLGLHDPVELGPGRERSLAIASTSRMRDGYAQVAAAAEWRADAPLRRGSIVWQANMLLVILAVIDALAAGLTLLLG